MAVICGKTKYLLATAFNNQFINRFKFSTSCVQYFKFSELEIHECPQSEKQPKPQWDKLMFGKHFSDHMLEIYWHVDKGWGKPKICKLHNFSLHPAAKVLHYAQELFEGMKAYRGKDNVIRLFRPDRNMERMRNSAERCSFPDFNGDELLSCIKKLIQLDADMVPPNRIKNSSLYIRPTMIGQEGMLGVSSSKEAILYVITGPVGPYFPTGLKPVTLLADPKFVRAWPGGSGDRKLGSNYAPTLAISKFAEKKGCQQVLWMFGDEITEVGVMNIFVFLINEKGEKELVTPPLEDGLILPGVTRISLLELARSWGEFKVSERKITMTEVKNALKDNRLLEVFGSGTASVVAPVGKIKYLDEELVLPDINDKSLCMRFYKTLNEIQFGITAHEWAVPIC